jgi:hypothetical protein
VRQLGPATLKQRQSLGGGGRAGGERGSTWPLERESCDNPRPRTMEAEPTSDATCCGARYAAASPSRVMNDSSHSDLAPRRGFPAVSICVASTPDADAGPANASLHSDLRGASPSLSRALASTPPPAPDRCRRCQSPAAQGRSSCRYCASMPAARHRTPQLLLPCLPCRSRPAATRGGHAVVLFHNRRRQLELGQGRGGC